MLNRMRKRWSTKRRLNRDIVLPALTNNTTHQMQQSFVSASSVTSFRGINGQKHKEAFLKGGVIHKVNHTVPKKLSLRDLRSGWSFSALSLSRNGRIDTASELLLDAYLLLDEVQGMNANDGLIRAAIRSFVLEIEKNYPTSSFHNFAHAVDVAQLMYTLITTYFSERTKKQELFYLLVIALCHDLGHIGVTTKTLQKLKCLEETETLEDFHIKKTMILMYESELSLMTEKLLKPEFKQELEVYMKFLIDATDINKCAHFLKLARNVKTKKRNSMLPIEYLAILMKVSDLANVTRDFDDSMAWGERLKIEMEAEKQFNLKFEIPEDLNQTEKLEVVQHEVFVLQRRIRSNAFQLREGLAANTLNFMSFAVKPIFSILPDIDPVLAKDYEKRVRDNERCWRLTL